MKSILLRSLLALALPLLGLQAYAQSPQNADCNVCNCTIGGSNLVAVAANACPGPAVVVGITAGATYRRFNTTIGNRYRVSVCGATALNTVMHIRSNTGAFNPILGACDDDGCGVPGGASSVEFVATETSHRVYLYVGACGTAITSAMNITITCLGAATAPTNDNPCSATPITIAGLTSCTTPVVGSTVGATQTSVNSLDIAPLNPNSGCGAVNFSGADVWYSVTVPATGLIGIEVQESGVCATGIGLYTAPDCAAGPYSWLTGTATGVCTLDGLAAPQSDPGIVFNPATYGLTPGQTVYIRIWERNGNENGNFTICAYNAQPPVNDEPCGAILLTADDPCVPQEYNTINAQPLPAGILPTGLTPTCGLPGAPYATPALWNPVARDVWFRVVVPPTGNMTVTTFAGTLTDMAMAWYRASPGSLCDPPGYTSTLTQVAASCNDNISAANLMPRVNSSTAAIPLTPGETIYIRVWNKKANEYFYHGTFSICITPNNPPVNDNPCGALPIEVNVDCIQIPGTVENATNTPNAPTTFLPGASTAATPTCGGATAGDVWFTVDVPGDLGASDWIRLNTDGLAPLDLAMAVYRDISGTGCPTELQLVQVTPTANSCAVGGTTIGSPINANMPGAMQLNVPNITPGERLYVRVWRQTTAQGPFTICATRPALPCQGTFYDSGGPGGQYANNESTTTILCPQKVGDVVTLTFSQFSLEPGFDFIRIYNQGAGAPLPANLIGSFTGTSSPGIISGSITAGNPNGCLMVVFSSDFIITAPGFAYKVSCGPPVASSAFGVCNTTVYNPGGPVSQYPGNLGVASTAIAPFMATYCPFNGAAPIDSVITLTFSTFDVEDNFDALYVFNANIPPGSPLNTAPVIASQFNSGNGAQLTWSGPYNPPVPPNGGYWGDGVIGPFTSSITAGNPGGCLTIALYSDGIINGSWQAQLTCGPPPPPLPAPVGDCNILFYETPGGSTGNYADNVSSIQTFCGNPGQLFTVTFEQFNLENQWDKMYVFDGPTTASPQISSGNGAGLGPAPYPSGGFWGTALPGPFTASTVGGCLTFHFVTDASVTRTGWRARTTCPAQAPNDNPCTPTGATLVTANPSCILTTYNNNATTSTPSVPAPGCGNYAGGDVWFRFVAPPSGRVFIDTKAGTLTDAAMALYSATSCAGPFTLIECDDDDGEGLMPSIDRMCNTLTPGATYYIRIFGYNNSRGNFQLCVVAGGAQTSLQTDCVGAFSLCNSGTFNGVAYGNGCGADISSINWGCLTGGERQGSWYAFRVQGNGNLGMQITPSSPVDVDWAVWAGSAAGLPNPVGASCMPTGAPIRCSFASQFNTQTVGGANPTAATGFGRNTFGGATAFATPAPAQNDAADGWLPGISVTAGQVYLLFVDDYHLNTETYTVTWSETSTPTAGNPVMGCEILPVEALQLEAAPQLRTVDLIWTTTTEQNTSHFIIERSKDGLHFTPIGRSDAAGYTNGTTVYQSVDDAPELGLNYYRLQQVDNDGSVALSNIVTALFEPKNVTVMVVPNPTRDQAELLLSAAHEGDLAVRITDGSGRMVASFLAPSGMQRIELPIGKLEAGSYTVQLVTDKGEPHARTRFVKQ